MESARDVALRLLSVHFRDPLRDPAADSRYPSREHTADPARGRGGGGVPLWSFQEEAVARLRAILRQRGGAILADSVGLGKTYVALALMAEELDRGGDCVVLAPAALRPFWRRKLALLGARRRPRLLTHTGLARGAAPDGPGGPRLIVVDEAHRFRNPETLRYAALSRLAEPGSRFLLVTATPINNGLHDLLHLLRLFVADDGFRDLGVASVAGAFAAAERGIRAGESAGPDRTDAPLARIIRAVVVRRTRAMVRSRFGQAGTFPHRSDPRIVHYAYPAVRERIIGIMELRLPLYECRQSGAPGAGALVRLGLLKRLDSSILAFERSASRLRAQTRIALDAVEMGHLPDLAATRAGGRQDGDPFQLVLAGVVSSPAPAGADLATLAGALSRDLRVLDGWLNARAGAAAGTAGGTAGESSIAGPDCDPKFDALVRLLDRTRGERTLVFTEYRDTARYLWRGLAGRYPVGRVDGGGAWLGRERAGRGVVVERFAPRANGRSVPARERVEVLVTTDVLAEGLNLQDARHVVSYDLPWNPVRLLQRIGRIDRAGSPHVQIVPYLFAPTDGIEERLGLTRRLRAKLASISAAVGAEHADAILTELLSRGPGRHPDASGLPSPGMGALLARIEAEDEDPVERLRTLWVRHRDRAAPPGPGVRGCDPDPDTRPACTAVVAVAPDSAAARLGWVVGVRTLGSGGEATFHLLEVDRRGRVTGADEAAVEVFERAVTADAGRQADGTGSLPPEAVHWDAVRTYLRSRDAAAAAPPRLPVHDPARRFATLLRRALAREPGLDTELLARADALLAILATPLSPVALERLRQAVEPLPPPGEVAPGDAGRWVRRGEAAVASAGAPAAREPAGEGLLEVVGALRVRVV